MCNEVLLWTRTARCDVYMPFTNTWYSSSGPSIAPVARCIIVPTIVPVKSLGTFGDSPVWQCAE